MPLLHRHKGCNSQMRHSTVAVDGVQRSSLDLNAAAGTQYTLGKPTRGQQRSGCCFATLN